MVSDDSYTIIQCGVPVDDSVQLVNIATISRLGLW